MRGQEERWERLLQRYHDGELAPEEREPLEARLRADPALRQSLEELRRLGGALRAGIPARMPPAAAARLRAALAQLGAPAHPLLALVPLMRRLAVAAAVAAALVFGALLARDTSPLPGKKESPHWVAVSPPGLFAGAEIRFRRPRPQDLFR